MSWSIVLRLSFHLSLSHILTNILFFFVFFFLILGDEQYVYVTNVPNQHDGPTNNHGPAQAGRGSDGRENYIRNAHVQAGQTKNGGIRLSKSYHNAFAR